MENEVAVIKPNALPVEMNEEFGKLVDLGFILHQNQESAKKAQDIVDKVLGELKTVDIKTVDAVKYETSMEQVREIRRKLKVTLDTITDRRTPKTKFFDDVRTLFTREEARIKIMQDAVSKIENAWEKEKSDRNKKQKEEADKKIAEAQKKIDQVGEEKLAFGKLYIDLKTDKGRTLMDTFNNKPNSELEVYAGILSGWVPDLSKSWPTLPGHDKLTEAEKAWFFSDYVTYMTQVKQTLIDSVPERLKLSTEQKQAQDKKDADNLLLAQKSEQERLESSVAAHVEGVKIDAVMDISVNAEPLVEQAKGSKKVLVYEVSKAEHLIPLIQAYIKNVFPKLTIEEQLKKFSFVITDANKRLADGEVITGVPTVEEFKTRTRS